MQSQGRKEAGELTLVASGEPECAGHCTVCDSSIVRHACQVRVFCTIMQQVILLHRGICYKEVGRGEKQDHRKIAQVASLEAVRTVQLPQQSRCDTREPRNPPAEQREAPVRPGSSRRGSRRTCANAALALHQHHSSAEVEANPKK